MKSKSERAAAKAAVLRRNTELVLTFLEGLDCARSLSMAILIRHGDWNAAVNLTLDFEWFEDPLTASRWWQAHRLLAKSEWLPVGNRRQENALASFKEAEEFCRQTNRRIRTQPFTGRAADVLHRARGKIASLLGDVEAAMPKLLGMARWGGGASTSLRGSIYTERYNKIASTADVTPALRPHMETLLGAIPWLPIGDIRVVPGNEVATVPKSYKTDRTIAVEPTVNAALQRGVGSWLVGRLAKWGITTHSQEPNQILARKGSVDGSFATIDLSMASDTVSRAIVEYLLPESWLDLLEVLRSVSYKMPDGTTGYYAKHSSMGNGYTFELETLVFSAIVLATYDIVGYSDYAVYGDDIVVSTDAASLVVETLVAAGFKVNQEKTYLQGPFRESCGEEFFLGVRCTPFYARNWDSSHDWCRSAQTLANWLRSDSSWFMKSIRQVWLHVFLSVPSKDRLKGPSSVSNVFHVNSWEIDPEHNILQRRPYGPWFGYRVKTRVFVPLTTSVSGVAGVFESLLRVQERKLLFPEWKHSGIELCDELVNTARRRGRWVQGSVIVDDWPAVTPLF